MASTVEEIVERHQNNPDNLIPILQDIQQDYGYLSKEAMYDTARFLKVSESKVYGVATFYTQFKFVAPGQHRIKVCQGTACHVRGSNVLIDYFKTNLGVSPGETTTDGRFSMERVACLGCCALAPVIVVDEEVHGHMTTVKVGSIVSKMKEAED